MTSCCCALICLGDGIEGQQFCQPYCTSINSSTVCPLHRMIVLESSTTRSPPSNLSLVHRPTSGSPTDASTHPPRKQSASQPVLAAASTPPYPLRPKIKPSTRTVSSWSQCSATVNLRLHPTIQNSQRASTTATASTRNTNSLQIILASRSSKQSSDSQWAASKLTIGLACIPNS